MVFTIFCSLYSTVIKCINLIKICVSKKYCDFVEFMIKDFELIVKLNTKLNTEFQEENYIIFNGILFP